MRINHSSQSSILVYTVETGDTNTSPFAIVNRSITQLSPMEMSSNQRRIHTQLGTVDRIQAE